MKRWVHIAAGALRVLWRSRLRSALTISSAILGVAGAVSSVDYALSGREKVLDQLRRMGTNVLIVSPQQSRNVGGRARTGAIVTTLVDTDYASLRREVPSIGKSSAAFLRSYLVKAGDLSKNGCGVIGLEPDYLAIRNWTLRVGNWFDSADERRLARVAVLGSTVAQDLFGRESPIGRRLLINRVPFEVKGVLVEQGQGLDTASEDNQVYVPLSTAMHRLANVNYFSSILFEIGGWDQMDEAARTLRSLLAARHRTRPNEPEDFQVQNQKQLIDTQIAASEKLGFLVRWIGFSALAVSGLGILAISWITVKERTGEIGTRRALGATRGDIFFQILFEAIVLSLVGCGCGLLAARESAGALARWSQQPLVFSQTSALIAFSVSLILNVFFAVVPARMASKLEPVRALQFE